MKAPFPYFGGKSAVADVIWRRFGNVPHYVEPFFGSGAVLLARPEAHAGAFKSELVNDKDCWLSNVWRALQNDPEGVAEYADYPLNENDFHARNRYLREATLDMQKRIEGILNTTM